MPWNFFFWPIWNWSQHHLLTSCKVANHFLTQVLIWQKLKSANGLLIDISKKGKKRGFKLLWTDNLRQHLLLPRTHNLGNLLHIGSSGQIAMLCSSFLPVDAWLSKWVFDQEWKKKKNPSCPFFCLKKVLMLYHRYLLVSCFYVNP